MNKNTCETMARTLEYKPNKNDSKKDSANRENLEKRADLFFSKYNIMGNGKIIISGSGNCVEIRPGNNSAINHIYTYSSSGVETNFCYATPQNIHVTVEDTNFSIYYKTKNNWKTRIINFLNRGIENSFDGGKY
jgi:hypothetical protein